MNVVSGKGPIVRRFFFQRGCLLNLRLISATIQLAFTNLKSAMETSEQCEICSKSTIKTPERHTKWSNTLKQFV